MTINIIYRSPVTKSDFEKYYDLRWRILRKPWNQPKGSEVHDRDCDAFHIFAQVDDMVIGAGCIHELEDGVGRILLMAVDDNYQKRGVGKNIITKLEDYAQGQNWHTIRLWARENAIDFYNKINYKIVADGYLLFGVIEHKIMEKDIRK